MKAPKLFKRRVKTFGRDIVQYSRSPFQKGVPKIPKGYRRITRGKWDRRRDKFWDGRRWCRQDAAHGLRIDRWKGDVIIRRIALDKAYWQIADEAFTEACGDNYARADASDREAMTRVVNAVLRAYRRRNAK